MGNLNSAIKRIENKGKKSVNPKKNQMAEVAPVVAAAGKAALVAGKAAAKGAAVGAKAGAKGAKVAAKTGANAAKSGMKAASKTSKPVARKLTTRRNVKNPRYRKLEKDDKGNIVRGKEFDRKLYDQDGNKKTQGYMSTIDGPTDSRKNTTSGSMRQMKKVDDAEKRDKKERDNKVKDTAQNLKKKTGDAVKKTVKKTGDMAKRSISTTSKAFGTSSFAKEGITFKDYLNKL